MQKNKGKIYTGTQVHGYTGTFGGFNFQTFKLSTFKTLFLIAWDRDNGTICFFLCTTAAKWLSHQMAKLQMENENVHRRVRGAKGHAK